MNTHEQIKWLEKQIKLYLNDLEDYSDPFELDEPVSRKEALVDFLKFLKEIHKWHKLYLIGVTNMLSLTLKLMR